MGIQITELTQNRKCYEKEFIDFEFNGKHISEFGLVAVFDGDRHAFQTTPFEDETTTINGVDGQNFWGIRYEPLKLSFSLATDGMTEAQVNAFKLHFKPGQYGKFIEDKFSHRYGWGRIDSAIEFKVVPFQKDKTYFIDNKSYNIKINEYKGEGEITFIFDSPFFYATENYLEQINQNNYQEALRAIYTNNTPLITSWGKAVKCYIGHSTYALGNKALLTNTYTGASELIYYNPSTAKTKNKITITLQPQVSSTWPRFFTNIADEFNQENYEVQYNSIVTTSSLPINQTVTNENYIHEFRYSTPEIIHSIHKTISIAYDFYLNTPRGLMLDLEEKLRQEIVNSKVIGWAISVLRIMRNREAFYDNETGTFQTYLVPNINCSLIGLSSSEELNWFSYFNMFMLLMLAECENSNYYHLDNIEGLQGNWLKFNLFTICFDSSNCLSTCTYYYNEIGNKLTKFSIQEENCGNAILTEYLILDGGDTLNDNCEIASCHYLKFLKGNLQSQSNLEVKTATIEYQYTY